MLLLLLTYVFCEVVELTIICEKIMKDESVKLAEFFVKNALREYNHYFSKTDVRFHFNKLLDFESYSNLKEFSEFSQSAGESDILKRKNSLSKIPTNLIVLYSSVDKINESNESENIYRHRSLSPCKGRYFYSLGDSNLSENIFLDIMKAVNGWVEDTFQVKLPNILSEKREDRFFNLKRRVKDDLKKCANEKQYDLYSSYNDSDDASDAKSRKSEKNKQEQSSKILKKRNIKNKYQNLNSSEDMKKNSIPLKKNFNPVDSSIAAEDSNVRYDSNEINKLPKKLNLSSQNTKNKNLVQKYSNKVESYSEFEDLNRKYELEELKTLPKKFKLPTR